MNLTGQAFAGHPFEYTLQSGAKCHDVHKMVIFGFSQPLVALVYLVGVGLLCVHLSHGVSAMFQSLGLRNYAWWSRLTLLARVAAVALFVGYMVVPAAVMLGYGRDRIADLKPKAAAPAAVAQEAGR